MKLWGRALVSGSAKGVALSSLEPIGFLGGIDPETGIVIEQGHELEGECVAGRILVFPTGKGSTVGSYTIYRLARNGVSPAAIINANGDAVTTVGAIIASIPMIDQVDVSLIQTGMVVSIKEDLIEVE